MAFPADTNWRWDPSGGNNANGGGFAASISGGVRITSPVTYTDLVIDGTDNTKVSSAGERAFVATDAGNVINITSGTGWTVQRAIINSVAGGVATMDRAMGTTGSTAGSGKLGGSLAVFTDALLELTIAGNTHEVWATATMTLTETLNIAIDGNIAAPSHIKGCASDGSANPTGDSRPLISCGGYILGFSTATYWTYEDLRVTGNSTSVMHIGQYSHVNRCSIANTSTTNDRKALSISGGLDAVMGCEIQSTKGTAISCAVDSVLVAYCYLHDTGGAGTSGARAALGVESADYLTVLQCIIDTCYNGIYTNNPIGQQLLGNTLYNCTTYGFYGTAPSAMVALNNILSTCGTGARHNSAQYDSNMYDWNDYYDCTNDRVNVAAGANDFDADPLFTDAANGDFSRTETDADGLGIALGVG